MDTKIGNLIKNADKPFFSLEFFPPSQKEQLPQFFGAVDILGKYKPLFLSVTYGAGGARQQNTLRITSDLASRGYVTMAHLTSVGASHDKIASFLDDLRANGINNVLALRGDAPKDCDFNWDKSEFRHADELVRLIRKLQPQMGIGVAAYPTPHPDSSSFIEDRKYTVQKFMAGADFAITQLFFDPREYYDLANFVHSDEACMNKPVIPGIMTIQSFESLRRVLSLCGANIPAKLYIALEEANAHGGAEAVREAGIKFTLEQIRQLRDAGAPGFHLFTLNRAELCSRIIEEAGLAH